jgi:LysM repeat protein
VTVEDIMKASELTDRSNLRVGQRLVIPEARPQE